MLKRSLFPLLVVLFVGTTSHVTAYSTSTLVDPVTKQACQQFPRDLETLLTQITKASSFKDVLNELGNFNTQISEEVADLYGRNASLNETIAVRCTHAIKIVQKHIDSILNVIKNKFNDEKHQANLSGFQKLKNAFINFVKTFLPLQQESITNFKKSMIGLGKYKHALSNSVVESCNIYESVLQKINSTITELQQLNTTKKPAPALKLKKPKKEEKDLKDNKEQKKPTENTGKTNAKIGKQNNEKIDNKYSHNNNKVDNVVNQKTVDQQKAEKIRKEKEKELADKRLKEEQKAQDELKGFLAQIEAQKQAEQKLIEQAAKDAERKEQEEKALAEKDRLAKEKLEAVNKKKAKEEEEAKKQKEKEAKATKDAAEAERIKREQKELEEKAQVEKDRLAKEEEAKQKKAQEENEAKLKQEREEQAAKDAAEAERIKKGLEEEKALAEKARLEEANQKSLEEAQQRTNRFNLTRKQKLQAENEARKEYEKQQAAEKKACDARAEALLEEFRKEELKAPQQNAFLEVYPNDAIKEKNQLIDALQKLTHDRLKESIHLFEPTNDEKSDLARLSTLLSKQAVDKKLIVMQKIVNNPASQDSNTTISTGAALGIGALVGGGALAWLLWRNPKSDTKLADLKDKKDDKQDNDDKKNEDKKPEVDLPNPAGPQADQNNNNLNPAPVAPGVPVIVNAPVDINVSDVPAPAAPALAVAPAQAPAPAPAIAPDPVAPAVPVIVNAPVDINVSDVPAPAAPALAVAPAQAPAPAPAIAPDPVAPAVPVIVNAPVDINVSDVPAPAAPALAVAPAQAPAPAPAIAPDPVAPAVPVIINALDDIKVPDVPAQAPAPVAPDAQLQDDIKMPAAPAPAITPNVAVSNKAADKKDAKVIHQNPNQPVAPVGKNKAPKKLVTENKLDDMLTPRKIKFVNPQPFEPIAEEEDKKDQPVNPVLDLNNLTPAQEQVNAEQPANQIKIELTPVQPNSDADRRDKKDIQQPQVSKFNNGDILDLKNIDKIEKDALAEQAAKDAQNVDAKENKDNPSGKNLDNKHSLGAQSQANVSNNIGQKVNADAKTAFENMLNESQKVADQKVIDAKKLADQKLTIDQLLAPVEEAVKELNKTAGKKNQISIDAYAKIKSEAEKAFKGFNEHFKELLDRPDLASEVMTRVDAEDKKILSKDVSLNIYKTYTAQIYELYSFVCNGIKHGILKPINNAKGNNARLRIYLRIYLNTGVQKYPEEAQIQIVKKDGKEQESGVTRTSLARKLVFVHNLNNADQNFKLEVDKDKKFIEQFMKSTQKLAECSVCIEKAAQRQSKIGAVPNLNSEVQELVTTSLIELQKIRAAQEERGKDYCKECCEEDLYQQMTKMLLDPVHTFFENAKKAALVETKDNSQRLKQCCQLLLQVHDIISHTEQALGKDVAQTERTALVNIERELVEPAALYFTSLKALTDEQVRMIEQAKQIAAQLVVVSNLVDEKGGISIGVKDQQVGEVKQSSDVKHAKDKKEEEQGDSQHSNNANNTAVDAKNGDKKSDISMVKLLILLTSRLAQHYCGLAITNHEAAVKLHANMRKLQGLATMINNNQKSPESLALASASEAINKALCDAIDNSKKKGYFNFGAPSTWERFKKKGTIKHIEVLYNIIKLNGRPENTKQELLEKLMQRYLQQKYA